MYSIVSSLLPEDGFGLRPVTAFYSKTKNKKKQLFRKYKFPLTHNLFLCQFLERSRAGINHMNVEKEVERFDLRTLQSLPEYSSS